MSINLFLSFFFLSKELVDDTSNDEV